MINSKIRQSYRVTIGIECHVQLKTKSKLFSAVGNDARQAPPNTLVSHIDFGLPGSLPVLNKEALHLASRAAFALNTVPQHFSKFDRKHYFYPDLPMGYQITQFDEPIIIGGSVDIINNGKIKTIGITRAHLEADAGKSTHPVDQDFSLVDLNRAGTPLLEIVSEPDMHSPSEAKAYAHELYLRMRYADVSDCNLFYGNMRFDVNVSISKTDKLGTRTETKNLNSFRAVEKAAEYEINRQIEVIEKGEIVNQETRGWDDVKQRTVSQRSKEDAEEYRYMPDPDLPPVILNEEYIAAIKSAMPIMPSEWRRRLTDLGLETAPIETLLQSQLDFLDEQYLQTISSVLNNKPLARQIANWLVNIDIPFIRSKETVINNSVDRTLLYPAVAKLVNSGEISSTKAKELIIDLLNKTQLPPDIGTYALENGFCQLSDETAIMESVAKVIADNPKAVEDIINGEIKVIGFLTGQVMKLSQGKANPSLVQQVIKKKLGI